VNGDDGTRRETRPERKAGAAGARARHGGPDAGAVSADPAGPGGNPLRHPHPAGGEDAAHAGGDAALSAPQVACVLRCIEVVRCAVRCSGAPGSDVDDLVQETLLRYCEATGGRRPSRRGSVTGYVASWTRRVVRAVERERARDAMGHVSGRVFAEESESEDEGS
jgi:hypothetical protein